MRADSIPSTCAMRLLLSLCILLSTHLLSYSSPSSSVNDGKRVVRSVMASVDQPSDSDGGGHSIRPLVLGGGSGGSAPTLLLGRGYTGHEWLPWFALYNCNACLYDPLLGRFLEPDPYIQAPDFSQRFNRYAYCLNNPLKYTDESGDFVITALLISPQTLISTSTPEGSSSFMRASTVFAAGIVDVKRRI